jgi:hypothetical protein
LQLGRHLAQTIRLTIEHKNFRWFGQAGKQGLVVTDARIDKDEAIFEHDKALPGAVQVV